MIQKSCGLIQKIAMIAHSPTWSLMQRRGGVRAVPQASKSKTSTHTSAKERRTSTFNFRAFLGRLQVGFDIAAKKKSQHANMPFDLSWIGVKKDAMVMF